MGRQKHGRFDDYDEDYKPTKNKHGKGHQSRSGKGGQWDNFDTDDSYEAPVPQPRYYPEPAVVTPAPRTRTNGRPPVIKDPVTPIATATPESPVQEIKGVQIDFQRLSDIQKVSQEHNGGMTFGIKFCFKGKKGLFRVIWFNKFERSRDASFNQYDKLWHDIDPTAYAAARGTTQ